MAKKEDLTKLEDKLANIIRDNKKTTDSAINALTSRISKLEKDMEITHKEKEAILKEREQEREIWRKEKEECRKEKEREQEDWKRVQEEWKIEREEMKEQIAFLKASVASLTPEEGEINNDTKEALKEELTKALTASMEDKLEATKEGWVEVVKKNIKKEAREEAQKEEVLMVHTTLEEEKMRQARRLNVRVTGIIEKEGSTPEKDGKELCEKLGYKEEEIPILKAWRAGKDLTKKRALILQFPTDESRATFLRKRMILRGLEGPPIYLDDDLTKMQVAHRRACMPRVHQARKEGKKASYRDGRVIIDGRTVL